jgi:hypothetical protein
MPELALFVPPIEMALESFDSAQNLVAEIPPTRPDAPSEQRVDAFL